MGFWVGNVGGRGGVCGVEEGGFVVDFGKMFSKLLIDFFSQCLNKPRSIRVAKKPCSVGLNHPSPKKFRKFEFSKLCCKNPMVK